MRTTSRGSRAELATERGVVVIGSMASPPWPVLALAERLGWPVLAEPTSGARLPGRALAAGQHVLGAGAWMDAHAPDVVFQVGATPTTRTTQRFVSGADRLVVVDRAHLEPDPEGHATVRIVADPDALAAARTPGRAWSRRLVRRVA